MSLQYSLISLHPIHKSSSTISNHPNCQNVLIYFYASNFFNFSAETEPVISASPHRAAPPTGLVLEI